MGNVAACLRFERSYNAREGVQRVRMHDNALRADRFARYAYALRAERVRRRRAISGCTRFTRPQRGEARMIYLWLLGQGASACATAAMAHAASYAAPAENALTASGSSFTRSSAWASDAGRSGAYDASMATDRRVARAASRASADLGLGRGPRLFP